jgi:hypothetical protein
MLSGYEPDELYEEVRRLNAENERLREALREAIEVAQTVSRFVKPFGLEDEGKDSEHDRYIAVRKRIAGLAATALKPVERP